MKTNDTTPTTEAGTSSDASAPRPTGCALIAEQPFFKGLTPKQIQLLATSALEVKFAPGQAIFREGDPANRFYLILKGKVALESDNEEGRPVRFMTLGPGDDLGWSWLFPPYYLHFSAYAVEPTEAIFFYGTRLRKECGRDRALAYEIMSRIAKVVVQRLEKSRRSLISALAGKPD